MKGKTAKSAHATGALAVIFRTDRFGRILDNGNAVALANFQQAVHITQVAVQVHGNNGLGVDRDGGFDPLRIDAPGIRKNIDEYRYCPQVLDRCDGRDPVRVRHDHFVTGAYVQGRHAHVQRTRTAGGSDCIINTEMSLERILETHDVLVAFIAPAISGGVGGVLDFQFGNRRLGVENPLAHLTSNVGMAATNCPPQSLT